MSIYLELPMSTFIKILIIILLASYIDTKYNSGLGADVVRSAEALAIVEASIALNGWE